MAFNACMAVAIVAGVFSAIVTILLVANFVQIRLADPLDEPHLAALRREIAASPSASPEIVAQIEALDLLARKAYFTSQAHVRAGAWLLLGGVAAFLASLRLAASFRPHIPNPEGAGGGDSFWRARSQARRWITVAGGAFFTAGLAAALFTDLRIPTEPADAIELAAREEQFVAPDWDEIRHNWPSFRGPGGIGVAHHENAPSEWDGESGKNIKWKTEIPLPGHNSPVVWGGRVFLTGATEDEREIYAFDAETGDLVWRHAAAATPGVDPPGFFPDTGYAPSTMVAHGSMVFAIFTTGDVVACDYDGNLVWQRNLGRPDNDYGHSSSLLAYDNLLYVQFDQYTDSKLLALDVADGREAWVRPRERISWASPALIRHEGELQLILNSERYVDSYHPLTGKHLWQVDCLSGEVAPSPAYGGGILFVANEYAWATAIRLGGTPDEPTAETMWDWDYALPDISSPAGDGSHFYLATSMGYVVCLDAESGETAWYEMYDEGFSSSPVIVGDRVFVTDRNGKTYVFKRGGELDLVAKSPLGERVSATPAFLDNRIYIRTEEHLWCVAAGDE